MPVAAMLCCLVQAACERRQVGRSGVENARYTLGPPWQSSGYWFYPREQLSYEATGLAVVDQPLDGRKRITADGEAYDPGIASGAHQTLQLPVILRVQNLENGLTVMLRVNDRGPAAPGRLLSVTSRAADLLGMHPGDATRVRLTEQQTLSQGVLYQVQGAPKPLAVAAPVGVVQERSLMSQADSIPAVARMRVHEQPSIASADPLNPAISDGQPHPGALWIDAGTFSAVRIAGQLAARIRGSVHRQGRGRSAAYGVRIGPFGSVSEADAALDRAHSAGVTGARITVE